MNQADENITLRENIVHIPQVYREKKKTERKRKIQKTPDYIYPLQFNFFEVDGGLKFQSGWGNALDLIVNSQFLPLRM